MVEFLGRSGHHLMFSDENSQHGVIVDSRVSVIVASGDFRTIQTAENWGDGEFSETDLSIATTALDSLQNDKPEPTGRLYTVPLGAQRLSKSALKNGTKAPETATYMATVIASGGQISFNELANITQYFETHDEDDSLWKYYGGNPAKKWASAIVEREPIVASGPEAPENLFQILEENPEAGPEFFVRMDTRTGDMDRLYRVDIDKRAYVWDQKTWNDLGQTEWNIWDYDRALDGETSATGHYGTHLLIDPESALRAATLISKGITSFSVEEINPAETALAIEALGEEDWSAVDAITAAGPDATPGVYDSDERSENASKQVRDGSGKFAKQGDRVMVNGDPSQTGTISRINPANGTVEVSLEQGGRVTVPGKQVEGVGKFTETIPGRPIEVPRVDFSGILAEPRTPIDRVQATIPGTLPPLSSADLHQVIHNFPVWVKNQREQFKPLGGPAGADTAPKAPPASRSSLTHPLLDSYSSPEKKKDKAEDRWSRSVTAAGAVEMTPDTSDVQPVYMAIVSPDDPRAVFKLISLVPANSEATSPMVYSRDEGKWVRDEQTLSDLNSATPPPVVALDEESLDDVLMQVDDAQGAGDPAPEEPEIVDLPTEFDSGKPTEASIDDSLSLMVLWGPRKDIMEQALTAAGGLDRNRGGAEKLRHYWTRGAGAAKIMWGTPGDWTRCVRYLGKYLGPRARGYCALRHKEVTGMWTGDKKHRQLASSNSEVRILSTQEIKSTEDVLSSAFLKARAEIAHERVLTASASDNPLHRVIYDEDEDRVEAITAAAGMVKQGGAFWIPLALPEGLESGDGRTVEKGAADIRTLPISLLWQIKTDDGHKGSVVVGRIERLHRIPGGIGAGYGHFDTGVFGREAERMVRAGFLRFVSADMDKFEAKSGDLADDDDNDTIGKDKLTIKKARVMAVTIVAKPAFQECTISIVPEAIVADEEEEILEEGVYAEEPDPVDAVALIAAGYIADAIPVVPPRKWFENPKLTGPTPLTVDDSGHVFGHIAAWATGHISPYNRGVNPPKSKSGYAYFHTGVVRTDDGTDVTVGQLTLAGGHAGLEASAKEAVRHYDDTGSAIADVHAGEDQYGIWVSGAIRPGATAEQIRALRASAPSGDWRPINNKLELVAVCQVNVPGFPIARAFVASGGHRTALVAAGAADLARLRPDPIAMLAQRLEALEMAADENPELVARAEEFSARFAEARASREAQLSARAADITRKMEEFGFVSKKSRETAAEKGEALPDGSYPIRNATDLKNAIKAYGRAKPGDRAKVRRHIMKRARALGKADWIPEGWKTAQSEEIAASLSNMREKLSLHTAQTVLAAATDPDDLTPAERQRVINMLKAQGEDVPEALEPKKAEGVDEDGRPKYKPGHQPRDYNGQFRDVLARLKANIGTDSNQDVVEKIEEANSKVRAGDYIASVRAGLDLKSRLDRLDSKALNPEAIQNVRETSRDLGTAIANLPLPFKNQAAKIRFSDLPPNLRELVDDFIQRVEDKIGSEDAAAATQALRAFRSGGDLFAQGDISREMSKLLRLLN